MFSKLLAWWALRSMGTWHRLELKDGDVLVLECSKELGRRAMENVSSAVMAALPGVRVLVLDGGLTVKGAIAREMAPNVMN